MHWAKLTATWPATDQVDTLPQRLLLADRQQCGSSRDQTLHPWLSGARIGCCATASAQLNSLVETARANGQELYA